MKTEKLEFIVTIDGPAGGGESTVAKKLAEKIGFDYLDTGAMYRASALAGMKAQLDWNKPEDLVSLINRSVIMNRGGRTYLNGEDVSDEIRTPEVTQMTRYAANNPGVRNLMSELQRRSVAGRRIVTEGRDQGTSVFPQADCKFYLTASSNVRALRRMNEMETRGESVSYDDVLDSIIRRDEGDMNRKDGPLRKPEDSIEISSDYLTPDEVIALMVKTVSAKISAAEGE